MPQEPPQPAEAWYADGLKFSCHQCGNCCSGPSGVVLFSEQELKAMAEYMGITPQVFREHYTQRVGRDYSLAEVRANGKYDCVFLRRDEEGKALCGIYPVRPTQCRTWPFWRHNLKAPKNWETAAKGCAGMAAGGTEGSGKFFPLEQIRIQRDKTPRW